MTHDGSDRSLDETIAARLEAVRTRIQEACIRSGRAPSSVALMLVTKTVERERIDEAIKAGHRLFGENRVQEAVRKFSDENADGLEVHMIGHLQTNKVAAALRVASAIHSVDRPQLVESLERRTSAGTRMRVYLQVNTSGEASKFGVTPSGALELARRISDSPALELRGLMTIALLSADAERVRPCFRKLREIRDELLARGIPTAGELSMGMSSDFEVAIEEGATLVRVGTAVFGRRPTPDSVYWPSSG
jgi:PLP dependent protein